MNHLKNVVNKKPIIIVSISMVVIAIIALSIFLANRKPVSADIRDTIANPLAIDEVRELAAKGDNLVFEDFYCYKGSNFSFRPEYVYMTYAEVILGKQTAIG